MKLQNLEKKYQKHKKRFKKFINDLETAEHEGVQQAAEETEAEVWKEVDCLSCANCCKQMTPTLTPADKKRIASHLKMSVPTFTKKYLQYNKEEKDWRMQVQPCVFLNLKDNKCSIYEVRPEDCSGFPHLSKSPMHDYVYIHKQNIKYCPATFLWVKKMMDKIEITEA